jgi:hypothetical protein
MRMQYLEKIENKVDCAHITFLILNEFKQLMERERNLLSIPRLVSIAYVNYNSSYRGLKKEKNIEKS